jgi:WD40 repeat protein
MQLHTLVQVLCCCPLDANTLLTCGSDSTIHLIDMRQRPCSAHPPPGMRYIPQSLGGGPLLINHVTARTAHVGMEKQVFAVDWNRSNSSQFVAASGWGDLRVFDIRKGENQSPNDFLLSFRGLDSGDVSGCAWSKNGRRLVGTWMNGSAYTFDAHAGDTMPELVGDGSKRCSAPQLGRRSNML